MRFSWPVFFLRYHSEVLRCDPPPRPEQVAVVPGRREDDLGSKGGRALNGVAVNVV